MEEERIKKITAELELLQSPASLMAVEQALLEQRDRVREELREELRRSLNFQHIKLHPDLKKHQFQYTEQIKDTLASLIADVLIRDGCTWDSNPVIKIEPAVFLSPSESLRDAAVVVVLFADGAKEHRSSSFSYRPESSSAINR